MIVSDHIIVPRKHSTQKRNGYKRKKAIKRSGYNEFYLNKRKRNKTVDREKASLDRGIQEIASSQPIIIHRHTAKINAYPQAVLMSQALSWALRQRHDIMDPTQNKQNETVNDASCSPLSLSNI
jgi:hypothetical protein